MISISIVVVKDWVAPVRRKSLVFKASFMWFSMGQLLVVRYLQTFFVQNSIIPRSKWTKLSNELDLPGVYAIFIFWKAPILKSWYPLPLITGVVYSTLILILIENINFRYNRLVMICYMNKWEMNIVIRLFFLSIEVFKDR